MHTSKKLSVGDTLASLHMDANLCDAIGCTFRVATAKHEIRNVRNGITYVDCAYDTVEAVLHGVNRNTGLATFVTPEGQIVNSVGDRETTIISTDFVIDVPKTAYAFDPSYEDYTENLWETYEDFAGLDQIIKDGKLDSVVGHWFDVDFNNGNPDNVHAVILLGVDQIHGRILLLDPHPHSGQNGDMPKLRPYCEPECCWLRSDLPKALNI